MNILEALKGLKYEVYCNNRHDIDKTARGLINVWSTVYKSYMTMNMYV